MCILKSMRKSKTKMTNLFGIYLRMLQYHSHHEVSIGSGTLIFCSMERPLSVRSLGSSSRASNNPATVRTEGGLTPKVEGTSGLVRYLKIKEIKQYITQLHVYLKYFTYLLNIFSKI